VYSVQPKPRRRNGLRPLEYEEDIHEMVECYIFIRYVNDGRIHRKKFVHGSGRYRRTIYSLETYKRVKWGKYRHRYIRIKKATGGHANGSR